MPRKTEPSARYTTDKPCPHDGTYERYVSDDHCCACRRIYMREYVQRFKVKNTSKPKSDRVARGVVDPTKGAAFPASRARLMAGH